MTAGGVGHPDYHDAGDDTAKIDAEMLRKNGQFVLQGVINVANETAVNLLIPDRLHLYNGMRMNLLNLATVVRPGGTAMYIDDRAHSFQSAPQQQGPRFGTILDVSAFGGEPGDDRRRGEAAQRRSRARSSAPTAPGSRRTG